MKANKATLSKLIRLSKKVRTDYIKMSLSIADLVNEVENISGIDNLISNYFPDDGLGISIKDGTDGNASYAGINDLISVYKANGAITEDDLNNTYL